MKKRILVLMVFLLSIVNLQALNIPEASSEFYVNDYAEVLSDTTEDKIVSRNDDLYYDYEVQFVVTTVAYLQGENIADYAYEMFNEWQIGTSSSNRGILLVLAIGEEDYYMLTGTGLDNILTTEVLSDLLYDYLEADFASGNYDTGVLKLFDQTCDEIQSRLEVSVQPSESSPNSFNFDTLFGSIITMILIVAALILLISVIRSMNMSRRWYRPTYSRPYRPYVKPIYIRPRRRTWTAPSKPVGRPFRSTRSTFGSGRSSFGGSRGSAPRFGGGGRSRGGGVGRH